MPEAEDRLLSKVGLIQKYNMYVTIYSSRTKINEWCLYKTIIKNPLSRQYIYFLVIVHTGYAMLLRILVCHGISHRSLVFSRYTYKSFKASVYAEKVQAVSGLYHGMDTRREHSLTIL